MSRSASPSSSSHLSAAEAAERLGISRATLYSYVSRGLVRSEQVPGGGRRDRRYPAEDVARLLERKQLRRDPERAGERSIDWGLPVVDSGITLIADGRLYYRGEDALELARTASFEEVAALLWTGERSEARRLFDATGGNGPRLTDLRRQLLAGAPDLRGVELAQALLPVAAASDPAAWDLRPGPMAATGARVLDLVARWLAARPTERDGSRQEVDGDEGAGGVAARLARAWAGRRNESRPRHDLQQAERAVSSALVLSADHELNVSAFTARCVTSAEATLYDAVAAGLAALKGRRHGGMTGRIAALLREAARPEAARATVAARLRRGEPIPGFGQPLYPDGDPRGKALLELARTIAPDTRDTALVQATVDAAAELLGERPTIDLGLVALARALHLPDDAPLALFATGRTAGWIAHAIEETERARLIRPRARYTGPPPTTPG